MNIINKELDSEQISFKNHQIEQLKREVDEWSVEIERGLKLLELKIPERQIKGQINMLREKTNMNEKNIKVLEKQVREKNEKVFEDVKDEETK